MILGDMVGRTTESPGSNAAGWGVAYALETVGIQLSEATRP